MNKNNLYLDNFNGNPTEQENRVARRLVGKRVVGSGRSQYSKGDVRDVEVMSEASDDDLVRFRVECKQSDKMSIRITWDWLKKITREAHAEHEEPALQITIKGGADDPIVDRDWILVPVRAWKRLTK